jgi:hypothetical protein
MTAHAQSRRPSRALLATFAATAALAGGAQALAPAPAAAVTDQANDCLQEQIFYFVDCEEGDNGGGGGGPTTAPAPTSQSDLDAQLAKDNAADDAKFRQQQTQKAAIQAWESEKQEREWLLDWQDYQRSRQVDQLIDECSFAKSIQAMGRADKKDEDEILDELERRLGAGDPGQPGAVNDVDLPYDCASLADQLRKLLKSQDWKDQRKRQKFQKKQPKPKPQDRWSPYKPPRS